MTKLTPSIDEELARKARDTAHRHGTSVSRIVSRFLERLPDPDEECTPTVRRLRGILPPTADTSEYRDHLERKYGR